MIGIMTEAVNARATLGSAAPGVRRSRWVGIIIKLTGGPYDLGIEHQSVQVVTHRLHWDVTARHLVPCLALERDHDVGLDAHGKRP